MLNPDYKPGDLPYPEQDERKLFWKFHYKGVLIILIPLILAPILLGPQVIAYRYIYLTACIYTYYILNLIPPGAIAFLYLIFVPLCGIAGSKVVSVSHYSDPIFQTFGCIFLGIMLDLSKLSERLALLILKVCGSNLLTLQAFFLLVISLCSLLFNSSLMAAFWMKAAQAVMKEYNTAGIVLKDSEEETYERGLTPYPSRPVVGIYLTVCYAATLGGMLSPFQYLNGSSMDLIRFYLGKESVSVGSFPLLYIGPFILGLVAIFLWINIIFLGLISGKVKSDLQERAIPKQRFKEIMNERKDAMGPWSLYSKMVLALIIISFLLLFLRKPRIFSGWDDFIKSASCGPSVVIIAAAIIVFALPINYYFCKYYMCRRPIKEGTIPSLLNWKAVNANTPWAHIFMLASSFCCVFSGLQSRFYELLGDTLARNNVGSWSGLFYGTFISVILTNLSPATTVSQVVTSYMMQVGFRGSQGPGVVGIPFIASLHNQFLLPTSTPANTIVAGWGNLRPYQFLLGGAGPTIVMLLFIPVFTKLLGNTAFPGYLDTNFNTTFTFTTFKPQ